MYPLADEASAQYSRLGTMLPNADKGAITGIEDKFTRTLGKKNYEQDTPKNHDLREVEWRLGNEQKKRRWNFHSIAFCIYRIIYSVAIACTLPSFAPPSSA
jgi:hypothetical protein